MHPVVITGLGVVGSFGAGREALAAALDRGVPVLRDIERPPGYHHPRSARRAALVDPATLAELVPPAAARRMSPPSRFAVAAARLALADAGATGPGDPTGLACVLATAYGPTTFTEKLLRQILLEGPESASPFFFTECVANAPSAQVAIAAGARGPNVTITQREAGPLLAVGRAAELLAAGRCERALAGAVDEMSPLLHAILDRFRALARDDRALPFRRDRTGFIAAEGAAVLLLETEECAARRGARPLARVKGVGRGFDPSAPSTGWGTGVEGLAHTIVGALTMAGSGAADLAGVVAGASGARAGDALEERTLAAVLGDAWPGGSRVPPWFGPRSAPRPVVVAPKAVTGEYGGGHLAAAVLAAEACPGQVLATSFGAGGAFACILLERP